MLKLSILDDDPHIIESLVSMITKELNKNYSINTYQTSRELLNDIKNASTTNPDVIIADIRLTDGDGIEASKIIQSIDNRIKIIYLTGYIENSSRIFDTEPSYFLIKPVRLDRLEKALDKVEKAILEDIDNVIEIITRTGTIFRTYEKKFVFAESNMKKVYIHLADETIQIWQKLDDVENMVSGNFLRCHKSFLVNMRFIKLIKNNHVELLTGETIPISKSKISAIKSKFTEYLGDST